MIVLNASVLVEMLRAGPFADLLWRELLDGDEPLVVPHLVDVDRCRNDERSPVPDGSA